MWTWACTKVLFWQVKNIIWLPSHLFGGLASSMWTESDDFRETSPSCKLCFQRRLQSAVFIPSPCFLYWYSPAGGTTDGSRFCWASGNPGRVWSRRGLFHSPRQNRHLFRGRRLAPAAGTVSSPACQSTAHRSALNPEFRLAQRIKWAGKQALSTVRGSRCPFSHWYLEKQSK